MPKNLHIHTDMSRVVMPADRRVSYVLAKDEWGFDYVVPDSIEIEGWRRLIDQDGFIIFARPDFPGCIRITALSGRLYDGCVELFMDRSPIDQGYDPENVGEKGFGTGFSEELGRMLGLTVDLYIESKRDKDSAIKRMEKDLEGLSDEYLLKALAHLAHPEIVTEGLYSDHITNEEWSEAVFKEVRRRGLL